MWVSVPVGAFGGVLGGSVLPVVDVIIDAEPAWFADPRSNEIAEALLQEYTGVLCSFVQAQRRSQQLGQLAVWRTRFSQPRLDADYVYVQGMERLRVVLRPTAGKVIPNPRRLPIKIGPKNVDIVWGMQPPANTLAAPPSWTGGSGATYKVISSGKVYLEFQIIAYDNTKIIAPPIPGYRGAQSVRVGLVYDTENVLNPAFTQRTDGPAPVAGLDPGYYRYAATMAYGLSDPYRDICVMGLKTNATQIAGSDYINVLVPGGEQFVCNVSDPSDTTMVNWFVGQYVCTGSSVYVVAVDGTAPASGPPAGMGPSDGSQFFWSGVYWRLFSTVGSPNQVPVYDNYYYRWTQDNTGKLLRGLLYMIWHADGGVEYVDLPPLDEGEILSGATYSNVVEVGTQPGPTVVKLTATTDGGISGDLFQDFNGNPPGGSIPINNALGSYIATCSSDITALNSTNTNPMIPYASNPKAFGSQAGMFMSTKEGTLKPGDVVMCAYEVPSPDPDDPTKVKSGGRVWLGYNGVWLDGGNPAQMFKPCGTVDAPPRGYAADGDYPAFSEGYMPAVTWLWGTIGHVRITLNPDDWKYQPPGGFDPVGEITFDIPL